MKIMRILARIHLVMSTVGLVTAFGVTTRPCAGAKQWKPWKTSADQRLLATTRMRQPRRRNLYLRWQAAGSDYDAGSTEFSESEIEKMDDLILSISVEQDDAQRRDKVAQVLAEKLLQPNGHGSSDRFMRLFEERLTIVGNQVRSKAASEAEANTQGVMVQGQPSETVGKQLWALVDMMIQSKVIFKQAKTDGLV